MSRAATVRPLTLESRPLGLVARAGRPTELHLRGEMTWDRPFSAAMTMLARTFAWLAALPYVAVVLLVVTGLATWSGVLYVLALGVVIGGLATLPLPGQRRPRRRGVTRAGVALVALVALGRGCTAAHGERLAMTTGPDGARVVDRLVDEGDVAVAGTRVLYASGMLHDDARDVPRAMRAAYAEMRRDEGDAPSPLVATYLGLQHEDAFDLVTIEPYRAGPPPQAPPQAAIVFLHGWAGNFDLPCWQVARAVGDLQVVTACPSTRWVGDWWSPQGERTVRRTLDVLRARGIQHVVLVGLSNGAHGAALLAPRLRGAFVGVVLVSGAPAGAPPAGAPTLVIHGSYDTMASVPEARAYAARTGAKYVALDAGHFAMLVRPERFDHELRAFVEARLVATCTEASTPRRRPRRRPRARSSSSAARRSSTRASRRPSRPRTAPRRSVRTS